MNNSHQPHIPIKTIRWPYKWLFIFFCFLTGLSLITFISQSVVALTQSWNLFSWRVRLEAVLSTLLLGLMTVALLYPAILLLVHRQTFLLYIRQCLLIVLGTPVLIVLCYALQAENVLVYLIVSYCNTMIFCAGIFIAHKKKKLAWLMLGAALAPFFFFGVQFTAIVEIMSLACGFSIITLSWLWYFVPRLSIAK